MECSKTRDCINFLTCRTPAAESASGQRVGCLTTKQSARAREGRHSSTTSKTKKGEGNTHPHMHENARSMLVPAANALESHVCATVVAAMAPTRLTSSLACDTCSQQQNNRLLVISKHDAHAHTQKRPSPSSSSSSPSSSSSSSSSSTLSPQASNLPSLQISKPPNFQAS